MTPALQLTYQLVLGEMGGQHRGCLETGSHHTVQAGLELTMHPRLAANLK